MRVNPHLTFNGQCEEAFGLYEKCLGAKSTLMMRYRDAPAMEQVPPGWGDKIIHATIAFGGFRLTGGDVPSHQYVKPCGFSVLIEPPSSVEGEAIFEAFAAGGEIQFALGETFWSSRFGMVVDRYGTPWMINCAKDS